ncbi:MAG: GNAT family N-acetyltransferase [Gammaproteobacteria bacterium]|nr:GNAT family N-acetyltransferase [Gammaproteobacteria bacterium]
MNIEIIQADYTNEQHAQEIPMLLNAYACDPMGGGKPIEAEVKDNLVKELSQLSFAFSILAYIDGQAVGLVNCFQAFSTFSCKPLINIHDVFVLEKYRKYGVGKKMLNKVEEIATLKGCCKITLEVLSNNDTAKLAYRKFGFSSYELTPEAGTAIFWQKKIPDK